MKKIGLYLFLFLFVAISAAHAATDRLTALHGTWKVTLNDDSEVTWQIGDAKADYMSSSGSSQIAYGIKSPGNVEFIIFWSGFTQTGYPNKNFYLYLEKAHADVNTYDDVPQAANMDELKDYYTGLIPVDETEDDVTCFNKFSTIAGPYPIKSGERTSQCQAPPTDNETTCPATKVLGAGSAQLNQLRSLRDSSLAQSALGRNLISIYYRNAVGINSALNSSPALKSLARTIFQAAAKLK